MAVEKRKPGRPVAGSKNPFHPQDEANYLSWDHGFNATTKDDCPYDPKDSEARQAHAAWQKGFAANTNRKAVAVISEDDLEIIPTTVTNTGSNLASIDTALLEQELKKRKIKDLEQQLQKEAQLVKALEDIRLSITKLKVLMGD